MAERVANAIHDRVPLIVEAGTGTGKTFAYLVPALLSGRRVIVSTGTRTLQDQLFSKDLPLVAGALGRPARVALLKGRANYLCRYRFAGATSQATLDGQAKRDPLLARLERWAKVTSTGDLAEVQGLADSHPLWPRITSTRENCIGSRCGEYARCHVVEARRNAIEADVVVVNHHLLLADLALKEDGFGDLLGATDAIVIDEAHQLPDLATQFFGASVSARQIESLLRDVRGELTAAGFGARQAADELAKLETALRDTQAVLVRVPPNDSGTIEAAVEDSLAALVGALRGLGAGLDETSREPAIAQCSARAGETADTVERIAQLEASDGVRSIEPSARGFVLRLIPFDVAERFHALTAARSIAWIFTSATLSVAEDFSHFAARLGLADAGTLQVPSPFDYESQALLYLPAQLPDPASPEHTAHVVDIAAPLVAAADGGAFLLFTSHRALTKGAALVRANAAVWGDWPLLVQGEAPREQLLQGFRESGRAVLLGTASFWEGVDVKGDALRLVIIEKLPFASPDDALTKARIAMLRSRGQNAFREYQLPEAALALKQGVGRLIRSETDRGVVMICDPRLTEKPYGRVFRAALPPMSATRDAGDAQRFLVRIAADRRTGLSSAPAAAAGP
jgi:ATP-dependent DNA helicase DinG